MTIIIEEIEEAHDELRSRLKIGNGFNVTREFAHLIDKHSELIQAYKLLEQCFISFDRTKYNLRADFKPKGIVTEIVEKAGPRSADSTRAPKKL